MPARSPRHHDALRRLGGTTAVTTGARRRYACATASTMNASNARIYAVSRNAASFPTATACRICVRHAGSSPSRAAIATYSSSDPAIVASQPMRRRIAAVWRPRMYRPGHVTIAGSCARQSSVDFPPDQPGVSSTTSATPTAATKCSGGIGGRTTQYASASIPNAAKAAPRRARNAAVTARLLANPMNTNWQGPTAAAIRGNTVSYSGRYLYSACPDQYTGPLGRSPRAARSSVNPGRSSGR